MGFFQSFINDANRSMQHPLESEAVEQALLTESPSEQMLAHAADTAAPLHSTAQAPGTPQGALPDMEFETAAPVVMDEAKSPFTPQAKTSPPPKALPLPEMEFETAAPVVEEAKNPFTPQPKTNPPPKALPLPEMEFETAAPVVEEAKSPFTSRAKTSPPPKALPLPEMELETAEPVVEEAKSPFTPQAKTSPPPKALPLPEMAFETAEPAVEEEAKSRFVPQRKTNPPARLPGVESEVTVSTKSRRAKEVASKKHPTESVVQQAAVHVVSRSQELLSEVEPLPQAKLVAKAMANEATRAMANEATRALAYEAKSHFSPQREANPPPLPARSESREEVLKSRGHGMKEERTNRPAPESTREASGPWVHIGTIEVIVEAAPVEQPKSPYGIGFGFDAGRSYLRRL